MGEFVVLEAPSLNPAEVRAYIGSQQGTLVHKQGTTDIN